MRSPVFKLLRRSRRSPPPHLLQFFNQYHSSYSSTHSLTNSSLYHHHRYQKHDYNDNWRSSTPHLLYSHYFAYLPRRFSTSPDFSDSTEPFFAVRALISLLDSYHDVTGLPWWIIISSSTVAMRLALFPLTVVQLKKMKRIGEMLPKLPPPFPPPMSGRSYRDQFSLFLKEKKAAGCPSGFWFFASFVVQVPCFFLWIMSIRTMSLNHHPGFDCGGTLWFQNLTEYPSGMLGPIFPLFIAGLHFTNVQISFRSSLGQLPGSLGLLAKLYKNYLLLMTLPIMFAAFNVPQGSLVYWLTNSSLSLTQLVSLRHPVVVEYLGLPKRDAPPVAPANEEKCNLGLPGTFIQTKQGQISAQSLSPTELVSYSIKVLTDGRSDAAIELLRLALAKDPGHVKALVILGQTLLQKKQFTEAIECLEGAVSKLLLAGYPMEVEDVDLLILSSQWAGIANMKQGKTQEGLVHLERIAQLDEPADLKCKAHYYDCLFMLSSALLSVDRKDDSLKYLQKVAAYDPAYKVYFKHLETDLEDFSSDLASSRRDF